jgi:hypothetical protein
VLVDEFQLRETLHAEVTHHTRSFWDDTSKVTS